MRKTFARMHVGDTVQKNERKKRHCRPQLKRNTRSNEQRSENWAYHAGSEKLAREQRLGEGGAEHEVVVCARRRGGAVKNGAAAAPPPPAGLIHSFH